MTDIIEPDIPIIDVHHHLWDPVVAVSQGQSGGYLLEDLVADLNAGHKVVASVYIECASYYRKGVPQAMAPIGEVEFACGIAAQGASEAYGPAHFCDSIIGYADFGNLGADVEPVLEALVRQGNGRLKGIRYRTNSNPEVKQESPEDIIATPNFRAAYGKLAKFGLSYDCWCYHPQLPDLINCVREHPDVPVAMNHCGGLIGMGSYANRREECRQEWIGYLKELAKSPTFYMKLGAFFMPVFGLNMRGRDDLNAEVLAAAAKPIIYDLLEIFGPERCMFESNFPVTRDFIDYATMYNAYKIAVADLTPAEKLWVFHDAAKTFYRMNV
ncbi:MAG: amidohydrolase family protein [Propionibacteriaceae bacterium]|jgi:predicted TIM-barrel fold metal-dependent hydrolase|nr:amidohydrolase family protein [Propionibacteriaceae bacterium]